MEKILSLAIVATLLGCRNETIPDSSQYKAEILRAELAFNEIVKSTGIARGFIAFAADSAVINRNGNLIKGIAAITDYYLLHDDTTATLEWSVEHVDVSASGDLGYTYGTYIYSQPDSEGEITSHKGVFHTVWKRQADGSWKFVYD